MELHARRRGVALDFKARLVNFAQFASPFALNTDRRIYLTTQTPSHGRECLKQEELLSTREPSQENGPLCIGSHQV